ncbi:GNAT family N-acetyltransferase [Planosporangium mesophilum]|uniref:N-acetyltransferase domain-containing protein n=1 Tax=Planosporangium mesophilum TaxID=689768 RepID=A0A8J3T8X0_9ACTN|nr:GNAT family N-acetyltransferase [Planosporangium mesophilum]NJC81138.1 GNAT family N-acetyltransferase [Planosporangium mesophilum]GII21211.1 hypothetical protein Pme01_08080 [Planosporangium mesophilum]
MTGTVAVGQLDGGDRQATQAAVELLRQSVPAGVAGLVPYHTPDYPWFLAAALTPPPHARTVLLRTVVLGGELIAVADWRILESELFLNGLSVGAEFRGRGYGHRLLADGLAIARRLGVDRVGLDVACDNEPALALYHRYGFREVSRVCWADVTGHPASPPESPIRIVDWPLFQAHRAAYGFADLTVRLGAGSEARIRMVGDAMRVNWDRNMDRHVTRLRVTLGAARAYAVIGSEAGPTVPPSFACFIRMRRATSEGGEA